MLDTDKPTDADGTRGLWLTGPKGAGKSKFARDLAMNTYGEDPFVLTDNKWFDRYRKEKVILIEDLDYITAHSHAHNLKHWADRYATKGEIKGGYTWLHHEILIVTSQATIEEIYGPDEEKHTEKQKKARQDLFEAIKDRFKVQHFEALENQIRKPSSKLEEALQKMKEPIPPPSPEQIKESPPKSPEKRVGKKRTREMTIEDIQDHETLKKKKDEHDFNAEREMQHPSIQKEIEKAKEVCDFLNLMS